MQNYSDVFAEVMAEFVSMTVPADQGDAAKGQITARAGERIWRTRNANVGYIKKSPGQTQYHGISVDALQDASDGTGADFLTDELQPGGTTRIIKRVFVHFAGAASPPTKGWQQPDLAMLAWGGPLTLKDPVVPPIEPPVIPPKPPEPIPVEPMPPMPTDWSSDPIGTMLWWTDMCPRLDAVYCNLLSGPNPKALRHADYGGWGNWVNHIREGAKSVAWVCDAIRQEAEYLAVWKDVPPDQRP